MYEDVIYYCVILALLIPFSDKSSAIVLLGMIVVLLGITELLRSTGIPMYLVVILGEMYNLLLYSYLPLSRRAVMVTLSCISISLSAMVLIDPYSNVLYENYTTLNSLLLEASILVLTLNTKPFRKQQASP